MEQNLHLQRLTAFLTGNGPEEGLVRGHSGLTANSNKHTDTERHRVKCMLTEAGSQSERKVQMQSDFKGPSVPHTELELHWILKREKENEQDDEEITDQPSPTVPCRGNQCYEPVGEGQGPRQSRHLQAQPSVDSSTDVGQANVQSADRERKPRVFFW